MGALETRKRRGSNPSPGFPAVPAAPENLVTEIVDQITEKQSRAARKTEARQGPDSRRSAALEEAVAGTPYQAVLSCAAEEPGTS